jgi:arsenite methyltransferase
LPNLRFDSGTLPLMPRKPDYGLDSPALAASFLLCGLLLLVFSFASSLPLGSFGRWLPFFAGIFLLSLAALLLHYSFVGKFRIRDQLLASIPWRGDEFVLDVSSGLGLVLIGAARRLTTGRAVGLDRWSFGDPARDRPAAVLANAELEGVARRIEIRGGNPLLLPFKDGQFDVVISNLVLREPRSSSDRDLLVREMLRVLKPGGRFVLAGLFFTARCLDLLRRSSISHPARSPLRGLYFSLAALLTLGAARPYYITASKPRALAAPHRLPTPRASAASA